MHIGIDARFCGWQRRGIGRYLEKLLSALARLASEHRFTLFTNKETALPGGLPAGKFRITEVNLPWYGLSEQLRFPFFIQKAGIDLMHWPNFNVPLFCPAPFVVTIHDLIVYHYPDQAATTLPRWRYRLKQSAYRFVLRRGLRQAKKIITVSDFTKRDLARQLKIPEQKMQTVYLAGEKILAQFATLPNPPDFGVYLGAKFGVNKPFLLSVGSFYPHKNLANLFCAFQRLRRDYGRDWQLVAVGSKDYFYEQMRKSVKLDRETWDNIVFTDAVDDKILDGLYRAARLFVFPSYYEGFGLPALEAASRGLPVVASKAAAIPEIMGAAAYYFDPANPSAMAAALDRVGGSAKIQARLAQSGFERLKHFDWDKTAAQTMSVYEQAYQESK